MADTWAGNANNQLTTFKAFLDGVTTGGFYGGYNTAPSNTREVMTVADLNTYGVYIIGRFTVLYLYDSFTGVSDLKCLNKLDFLKEAEFDTSVTNVTSCSGNGLSNEILYSSSFSVGAQLYTNRALTTAKTFASTRWLYNYTFGGGSYEVNTSGVILTINFC